ncbi:hypothetical protein [Streptomyces sp. NBC_01719]|uniref:hypothetical protein n=1 Tax=Streptomyces sp. NBC_01719 TaxID=2975920 RepID=UPI002251F39E|nr:hypothetical protein [Streptomyces sp. NBC_01719]MCX4461563.1 hypothetical protein [Streptomyces sp. NBC_01719]
MSDEQKREVWRRWRDGQSLSEIGRALGKVPGSIHGVVAANGGFVPAVRTRSAGVLSLAEREEISRGLAAGDSLATVSVHVGYESWLERDRPILLGREPEVIGMASQPDDTADRIGPRV